MNDGIAQDDAPLAQVVAERYLRCSFPGAPLRDVRVVIHAPVQEEDGSGWRCVAVLENLFQDTAVARGVDSLQALQLALREVRDTLQRVRQAGGSILWQDGSGELSEEDFNR